MPGFDGTGPMGAGPMTGGARGYCLPASAGRRGVPAGAAGFGRGMAYRRGARAGYGPGRGAWAWGGPWRGFGYAFPSDEKNALKQQEQALQSSLDAIRSRLSELDEEA
ncbi:MAG: hypothetical protein B5M56_00700 [Desulfococcus sp. 4484_241]|nr:MAG: hypothetical protein B5M56_00700 [Desulfococcus sp. 4484_241]RLC29826.1 MAG: hypothetical protein DRH32_06725 [Deltaproteobacteria bacterium]